jgi:hypothetical protein
MMQPNSTLIGLTNPSETVSESDLIDGPVSAGVTYAYINDPNQQGSPHIHTAITD